jgi:3-methyladenine DNA glycosylase AlkD
MQSGEVIKRLKSLANPANVKGMAQFGINPQNTLGVSMPELRTLAKEITKDHELAQELWVSGIHEAKILACLIDEPKKVTEKQMDSWVKDFDSWDVCDQCIMNLFDRTPMAFEKAKEWSESKEEFIKRAGFAMMASLAVHDKKAADEAFMELLPFIVKGADDERNFVRKAVNWGLRQIGKRNSALNRAAIKTAEEIQQIDAKSARWIAADALRELTGEAVQVKISK